MLVKEYVKEFIKENLDIKLNIERDSAGNHLTVVLYLKNEVISSSFVDLKELKK